MSTLPHDDQEPGNLSSHRAAGSGFADGRDDPRDPEITLGTMTVLGIFLALAVLCAGFFGFGYSVALRRAGSANTSIAGPSNASAPLPKPAPGSPSVPVDTSLTDAITAPPSTVTAAPPTKASAARVVVPASGETAVPAPLAPPREPVHVAAVAAPGSNAVPAASSFPGLPVIQGPSAQTMVQVAALHRPEDAQIVVSALKSKGYEATVRNSPQDSFLHVQVGPFSSKKDAEAMRQRILADGFNAILK